MIELKNVTKKYIGENSTSTIYEDLNFKVNEGEFVAIVGRSGSGKTSLLNIVSGLIDFEAGEVEIDNHKYSKMTRDEKTKFRGKNLSFIFQQFHLIPNLTVAENIELSLDINHIPERFSVDDILEKIGLTDKKNNYPFELSGGEQQRVAIARAFVGETKLLLADEPTGNLDEKNANNIMKLLKDLHREAKNTIILITHDKNVADFADTIYELNKNSLDILKK